MESIIDNTTYNYNPFELYPPKFDGELDEKLWSTAGQSSPFGAFYLLIGYCVMNYYPLYWCSVKCLFKIKSFRSDLILSFLIYNIWPITICFIPHNIRGNVRDGAWGYLAIFGSSFSIFIINVFKYHFLKEKNNHQNNYVINFGESIRPLFCHGTYFFYCFQAVVWEFYMRVQGSYHVINAVAGLLQLCTLVTISRKLGCGIEHTDNDRGDIIQLRSNLTLLFIVANTIWNLEYIAEFSPRLATFSIFYTLIGPLYSALLSFYIPSSRIDWLEFRAKSLGAFTILVYTFPALRISCIISAFNLWEDFFKRSDFRYCISAFSLVATIAALIHSFFLESSSKNPHISVQQMKIMQSRP